MPQTVLILGQSGRFGRNAKIAFKNAGWTVRGFDRATGDLSAASRGVDVIVNAWNPPYPDWKTQVPRLHKQVREAARVTGATVIVPGNVYVFGAAAPQPWSDSTAHLAANPLGRIRIEMEAAYAQDQVKTIILRAGDFIDTDASGNWFDRVMTKDLTKDRFTYPGRTDAAHAWAFLPDLTKAAVGLADMRDDLPDFTDVAFPGYTLTGSDLLSHLRQVTRRNLKMHQMNWLPLQLTKPFWPMARCLLEMRYLWDLPHRLDGAKFHELLPQFQPTKVSTALDAALGYPVSVTQRDVHPNQAMSAGAKG